MKKPTPQNVIQVFAHWKGMRGPTLMGVLYSAPVRGKEIFSFEYHMEWLQSDYAQVLDPSLNLFKGLQYGPKESGNFGVFLDSSPDRWGRQLMKRREEQFSRAEGRLAKTLLESDYLLGVYDGARMGGLRFRTDPKGPFLDNNADLATPPWVSIRALEQASLALEKKNVEEDPQYAKWLKMLIAPGASLGGARPKAGVVDNKGHLWIAKFPSRMDEGDVGGWEAVVHQLSRYAKINTAKSEMRKFSSQHHTFMTKRFDRDEGGSRIHFASAMTLLQHQDGDDGESGVSYLEFIDFIMRSGAEPTLDLEELWRRIVFFICVSNVDDHLRNHGFLLDQKGWRLSPAYDINPVATGNGLKLNISESDNSQDLDLARSVAKQFRLSKKKADTIIIEVVSGVKKWKKVATDLKIPRAEQDRIAPAFRMAK